MPETPTPPTPREQQLFEAATEASPAQFVRLCARFGKDPRTVLDSFDAEPWRWFISFWATSDALMHGVRDIPFPPEIRSRLDEVRTYLDAPWWRKAFRR